MSYQSTILADNPIAYWPLDETSGTVAKDLSGNNYNGTYHGTYTLGSTPLVTGVLSVLMGGHGTESLVTVGDIPALIDRPASWSLECWFKTNNLSGNPQGLFAGGTGGLCIRLSGSELELLKDQIALITSFATNFTIGAIYCVHATYDNTTFRIYINGALFSSYSSAGQSFSGIHQVLGADPTTGDYNDNFSGNLGQMAMYNTVLTAAQILNHYNAGIATPSGSPLYTGSGTNAQFLLLQR